MLTTFLKAVNKVVRKMSFESTIKHINYVVIKRIQNPYYSILNIRHHITKDQNIAVRNTKEPVQLNASKLTNYKIRLDIYRFVVKRGKLELIDINRPS